jgi:SAM-dependent methyltransferase
MQWWRVPSREQTTMTISSTFTAASGDGYELQMGRWSRRLAEPFLDFCGLSDGETILDAGCGTGALTSALTQRTKTTRIKAIDFSAIYVEHARQQVSETRVEFSVGDICALPYDAASFDRVLSLLVLHFVPRTEQAVAELRRVAPRRNGRRGRLGRTRRPGRKPDVLRCGSRPRSSRQRTAGAQLYTADDAARGTDGGVARRRLHRHT